MKGRLTYSITRVLWWQLLYILQSLGHKMLNRASVLLTAPARLPQLFFCLSIRDCTWYLAPFLVPAWSRFQASWDNTKRFSIDPGTKTCTIESRAFCSTASCLWIELADQTIEGLHKPLTLFKRDVPLKKNKALMFHFSPIAHNSLQFCSKCKML